jgi:hypothetical protein
MCLPVQGERTGKNCNLTKVHIRNPSKVGDLEELCFAPDLEDHFGERTRKARKGVRENR